MDDRFTARRHFALAGKDRSRKLEKREKWHKIARFVKAHLPADAKRRSKVGGLE
jgi:hypothetical protein